MQNKDYVSIFLFYNVFGEHQSFCGVTDTPTCNGFLRFTHGVTPADLLTARTVAGAFDPLACVHMFPSIGGTQTWN